MVMSPFLISQTRDSVPNPDKTNTAQARENIKFALTIRCDSSRSRINISAATDENRFCMAMEGRSSDFPSEVFCRMVPNVIEKTESMAISKTENE
ncbi:hypothetical protein PSCICO_26250 [Pseudomonas cichorii]|nr:hypothetical protein PSCICO_26250 [Pseudomonas cichorii]